MKVFRITRAQFLFLNKSHCVRVGASWWWCGDHDDGSNKRFFPKITLLYCKLQYISSIHQWRQQTPHVMTFFQNVKILLMIFQVFDNYHPLWLLSLWLKSHARDSSQLLLFENSVGLLFQNSNISSQEHISKRKKKVILKYFVRTGSNVNRKNLAKCFEIITSVLKINLLLKKIYQIFLWWFLWFSSNDGIRHFRPIVT